MSILLTEIASIIESETEGGYLEHWDEFKSGLATEQQQDYFLGIAKSISGKIREVIEGVNNPYPEWESLACQYHIREWVIFEETRQAILKALDGNE